MTAPHSDLSQKKSSMPSPKFFEPSEVENDLTNVLEFLLKSERQTWKNRTIFRWVLQKQSKLPENNLFKPQYVKKKNDEESPVSYYQWSRWLKSG